MKVSDWMICDWVSMTPQYFSQNHSIRRVKKRLNGLNEFFQIEIFQNFYLKKFVQPERKNSQARFLCEAQNSE
jgi:hypothetical protein